ncbi:MAG: mechanosensitive ion channel [Rhodopirellula sp.]|nr:mechanosensitive ion channel [Rhodopirellula sp.]
MLRKSPTTTFHLFLTALSVVGLLCCASTGNPVLAQGVQQAGFLQPATPTEPLTVELIEARRKEAAESPDLSDDAKKKVEEHYKVALDGLKRISDLAASAAQFKQESDDAQLRVQDRKQRLNQLQSLKPELPTFSTLPELEQERTKRDVQLTELKAALAKIEAEPTTRANRRKEIRGQLLSAPQRITDIDRQLAMPAPADESPLLTQARLTELRARRLLTEAEQPANQNELTKYDAEDAADFVRLERDVRTQEVALVEAELKLFDEEIAKRRAKENDAALKRARDEAIEAEPLLQEEAEISKGLAEKAVALSKPLEETRAKLEATKIRLDGVQKQFAATQQKVENIGLSDAVGGLLRRQRSELPDVLKRQANVRNRREQIEDAQYDLFDADDQRARLANRDPFVQAILEKASPDLSEAERKKLEEAARDVFDRRAEYLDQLIRSSNSYLDSLFELDQTEQLLIAETQRYLIYIDERVLWIRSNKPLYSKLEFDDSDRTFFAPAGWVFTGEKLFEDASDHLLIYGLVVLVFSLLILLRPRFRVELQEAGTLARKGNCTSFAPTWQATWGTILMSVAWPGLIWFTGSRLLQISNGSDFSRAVGAGLTATALGFFPLELLRRICRVGGLADNHFDWPDSAIRLFRSILPGLILFGLPLVFMTTTIYMSDAEHGLDILERSCFVAGTLVLTVFLRRVLRPDSGVLCEFLVTYPTGWLVRTKWLWYWGSLLAPLSLAGLTIAGYYYTAQQLSWRLFATIMLVLGLQLVRALLQRLLIVQRRKLSIEQAKQRRRELMAQKEAAARAAEEAAAAVAARTADEAGVQASDKSEVPAASITTKVAASPQSTGTQTSGPAAIVPPEELRADVEASTEQSRRLLAIAVVTTSLVGVWLIWVDALPALRILDQWQLWATTVNVSADDAGLGSSPMPGMSTGQAVGAATVRSASSPMEMVTVVRYVTPRDIGLALLIAMLTFACARNIPGLMELWVLQRLPLDQSIRYAVTTLTSYMIILLGVILSFNAISVGWSKVQWLATALTFGLAFGLQEIFANFVAGLILLFERPIRIGDVVTVDDVSGVVSRIRIRATTITNWDRKEYVIPNKEFITGRMLNWTLTDKVNRVVINIGVAYGSDVEKTKELLLKVCNEHPLILDEPATQATFEGFGDNSLNFVVRTYLPDLDNRLRVIDALHTSIDRVFREAKIEIAFPQRDLHLRSVDPTVAHALQSTSAPTSPPPTA